MSMLLLTMGPNLSIAADIQSVSVGDAGVIRFRPVGKIGRVRWALLDSTLPPEWPASLEPDGDNATLSTLEAITPGTFLISVMAVDDARTPVVRTFEFRVLSLPLTISGSFPEWYAGQPVSGSLSISGGQPPYGSLVSTGLPSGVTLSISSNQIIPSGSTPFEGSGTSQVSIADSIGATASYSADWVVGEYVAPLPAYWEVGPSFWSPYNLGYYSLMTAPSVTAAVGTMGATISGAEKWSGAVSAPDGKIYCMPYHTGAGVFVINPAAGTASVQALGATYSGAGKWRGGCLGPDGKIYAIPSNSADILIIDPIAGTATRSAMGASLSGAVKWAGGCLGPDGKIYGIPHNATDILIIDPIAGTATRSAMGATLTGASKWFGGCLGPDGKIYCMPHNATDILIIDPVAGTATRSAMGATLPADNGKWIGGVIASDGKIYAANLSPSVGILIIDPSTGTASIQAHAITGAWAGGCVGGDGCIYFSPQGNNGALKYDIATSTPTVTAPSSGTASAYQGCAIATNGTIYTCPYNANDVMTLSSGLTLPADGVMSGWINKL